MPFGSVLYSIVTGCIGRFYVVHFETLKPPSSPSVVSGSRSKSLFSSNALGLYRYSVASVLLRLSNSYRFVTCIALPVTVHNKTQVRDVYISGHHFCTNVTYVPVVDAANVSS